jgi:hypothetical protein
VKAGAATAITISRNFPQILNLRKIYNPTEYILSAKVRQQRCLDVRSAAEFDDIGDMWNKLLIGIVMLRR